MNKFIKRTQTSSFSVGLSGDLTMRNRSMRVMRFPRLWIVGAYCKGTYARQMHMRMRVSMIMGFIMMSTPKTRIWPICANEKIWTMRKKITCSLLLFWL